MVVVGRSRSSRVVAVIVAPTIGLLAAMKAALNAAIVPAHQVVALRVVTAHGRTMGIPLAATLALAHDTGALDHRVARPVATLALALALALELLGPTLVRSSSRAH